MEKSAGNAPPPVFSIGFPAGTGWSGGTISHPLPLMSHTTQVILTGFAVLAVFLAIGGISKGKAGLAKAARWFIPCWFIGAAINLTIGIVRAGYTFAEEAPIFLIVFGVPAVVAFLLSKLFGKA